MFFTTKNMVVRLIEIIVVFLLGGVSGYYVRKLTDRRREKEQKRKKQKSFLNTKAQMPNFIVELKSDLSDSPDVREFFVLPKGVTLGGSEIPRFIYHYEKKSGNNLENKMQILENMFYVSVKNPKNTPIYRMTEDFVKLVKKYG